MAVDYRAIRDALASVAQATGYFDQVVTHEPKSAPGKGLVCCIFAGGIAPSLSSGLSGTSAVLRFSAQVRCSMLREPQDDIDLDILEAVDTLAAALSGDFDLDVTGVRGIDLLGSMGSPSAGTGAGLAAEFGYIDQDGHMYRVAELNIPIIINDVWAQGA